MAKFIGKTLHLVALNVDDKEITYDVEPTHEQLQEAVKNNIRLIPEQAPATIKYLIKNCLRADLSEQTQQGRKPDPHEDRKYEIYELIKSINRIKDDSKEYNIESDHIVIIKERAKKVYMWEVYRFLVDVLEGKIAYQEEITDKQGN